MRLILVSTLILAQGLTPLLAMTPPSVSANVVPRSAASGLQIPSGAGGGMGFSVWQSERSGLRSGTQRVGNPNHERSVTFRTTLFFDHSFGERFSALLTVPHIYNRVSFGGTKQISRGLGDVTLYGKWSFYRDRILNPVIDLQWVAGVDLPTGETKQEDGQGNRLPITQQPGSNSTDGLFGIAAAWTPYPVSTYADITYRLNGGAAYTFGDVLAVNVGVSVPFHNRLWNVTGELNFEATGRDTSSLSGPGVLPDKTVRDSGGETVYFTPGVQWRPWRGWAVTTGVQWPLYQNYRGTQLAADANYLFSIYRRFGARG